MPKSEITKLHTFVSNTFRLAIFEFKKRSLDTYFGWLWSMVSPISQIMILLFILRFVFKSHQEHLVLWLISGIAVWGFIQSAILKMCQSLVSRRNMVQSQNLNHFQLIIADLLSETLIFMPFIIIAIVVAIFEQTVSFKFLLIIFMLVALLMFLFGIGLLLATLTVFMRDIPHFTSIALQLAFWLTPIAYARSALDNDIAIWISFNPFTYFVELSQNIFLDKSIGIYNIVIPMVITIFSIFAGVIIHRKLAKKVALYI